MTSKAISVDNVGPIDHFEFSGSKPGVTIFSGPNGIGKSIFQKAIQAAARGKGKVPLRDHTNHGKVEAFGAVITIGGTCRHTGSFEVLSLDGRFNLADLVDPRIDDPAKADAARVRALVSLTGVVACAELFRKHEAFGDFDRVVKAGSVATDDMCVMASKIQADYYEAARSQEAEAERATGHAAALVPPKDLDLTAEVRTEVLQRAYDEARDVCMRLNQQTTQAKHQSEITDQASKLLKEFCDTELRKERGDVIADGTREAAIIRENAETITQLEEDIAVLRERIQNGKASNLVRRKRVATIDRQLILVDEAKKVLETVAIPEPSQAEVNLALAGKADAEAAVERGALIRKAKADAVNAASHRKSASVARDLALKYRDAGKATDAVLSASIKCKQLRVESDGKAARLVTDTDRGKSTLYHDLSDGQKYKIAIDIGADNVGEDGLLTVDQPGWEGVDADNRIGIDQHGKERSVHIWVLEASRVPGAPREIVARPFDDSPIEAAPRAIADEAAKPNSKAIAQAALSAFHIADVNAAAHPVKTPAPKPVAKAVAQSDDIPF